MMSLIWSPIPSPITYHDSWNAEEMTENTARFLGLDVPAKDWFAEDGMDQEAIKDRLIKMADHRQAEKTASVGADIMRRAEKSLLLQVLDQSWKEHLLALDHMKQASLRPMPRNRLMNINAKHCSFNHMPDNLPDDYSVMAHIQRQPESGDQQDGSAEVETPTK